MPGSGWAMSCPGCNTVPFGIFSGVKLPGGSKLLLRSSSGIMVGDNWYPTFESVKDSVRDVIAQDMELYQHILADQRKGAKIDVHLQ